MTLYRGGSDLAAYSGGKTTESQELLDALKQHETNAETAATNAATSETNAATSATNSASSASSASTSETNAGASEAKAKKWAEETVDVAVETGLYSAKHHATKASNSASAASTSATNAATSETNAKSHYDAFRGVYYGALTADPTADPNGAAVGSGDWYFNTTQNKPRIYNGTSWSDVGSSSATITERTLTSGQTSITGLSYSAGYEVIWLNGVRLTTSDYTATDGSTVTLADAAVSGDTFALLAFGTFNVANTYTKSEADLRYQQIDNLLGYRNVVVDGDMTSWQAGTSFTGRTASGYGPDMHRLAVNLSGTWTVQQVADHPILGANGHCMEMLCTAADTSVASGDYAMYDTNVEGSAYAQLYQKTQTVSFWVKTSTAGVYGLSLRNGGSDRSYVAEITVNAANTWEKKTVTITTAPSGGTWYFDNRLGLVLGLALVCSTAHHTATTDAWQTGNFLATANNVNLAAALNNYIRITDVQLEEGDKATPFERLGPGGQLRRCLRYFEKSQGQVIWQGDTTLNGVYSVSNPFKEEKRAAPTITYTDIANTNFPAGSPTTDSVDARGLRATKTASAGGSSSRYIFSYMADARL